MAHRRILNSSFQSAIKFFKSSLPIDNKVHKLGSNLPVLDLQSANPIEFICIPSFEMQNHDSDWEQ